MGLDTVELVMEVEAAFGIAIPDEDASRIITVGDPYRDVLSRLPAGGMRRCASAAAFYRVRRALIERCGVDRGDVRPSTPTATLIPETHRRSTWQGLGQTLEWQLPPLVRPAWMVELLITMTLMATTLSFCAAAALTSGLGLEVVPLMLVSLFFLCPLSGAALYHLTSPFASRFPDDCETIEGVIRGALSFNYARICSQVAGWDPREVWVALQDLVARQAGVAADGIGESVEFVRDLGMD